MDMSKITSSLSLPVRMRDDVTLVDSFGDVICVFEEDVDIGPIMQAINEFDTLVYEYGELLSPTPKVTCDD